VEVVGRGDVWWIDFGDPPRSTPAFIRPVVVIQNDGLNRSAFRTVVVVPCTTRTELADIPGHVMLEASETGLDKDCVAVCPHISTVDKSALFDRAGRVSSKRVRAILDALDVVLGR